MHPTGAPSWRIRPEPIWSLEPARGPSLRRDLRQRVLAAQGLAADEGAQPAAAAKPAKRYDMKKSINLWALPYPQKMTLKECFQLCKEAGFDGSR